MFLKQNKNLLPKKLADGVALKTLVSQHQLLRFRGFKKLKKFTKLSIYSKFSLGGIFVLYLLGYQPTLAIPPIKQSVVKAEFIQQQSIDSSALPQAFNLPHPGYISTHFASWHPGIDIAVGLGMPIKPVAKGIVSKVVYGFWGLGHYVVVEHDQGFQSTYGHMGRIFVKKGDLVESNSTLGEVGMTGHTTGPHTHLEIRKNGQAINPETILPSLPNMPIFAAKPLPTAVPSSKIN